MNTSNHTPAIGEANSILQQLLHELEQQTPVDAEDRTISKGQALIKSMVDAALQGDPRMQATILKLMEKLEEMQEEASKRSEEDYSADRISAEDKAIILRYYARNKQSIEQALQLANPAPSSKIDDP